MTQKEILARLAATDRSVDMFEDVRARLMTPLDQRPPMTDSMKRRMRRYMARFDQGDAGGLSYGLFSDASLYHDFAADKSLEGRIGPAFDLSRASGAMQYDSTGRLVWAPENLLDWSNDFTNAAWTKRGTCTAVGPNELTGLGSAGNDCFNQGVAIQVGYRFDIAFELRTVSTSGTLRINNPSGGASGDWFIDLSQISAVAYEYIDRNHPAVTIINEFAGASLGQTGVLISRQSGATELHIFMRQIQVNRGTFAQPYNSTTSAVYYGPRFDHANGTSLGLLIEEERTNLLTYSQDMTNAAWAPTGITVARNVTGPDGVANSANTLTATLGNGTIANSVTAASASHAVSALVRRKTGTGQVWIGDGTNEVEITSQINTTDWTLVQQVATIANPKVGFRIGTSGDEIEVADNQCEVGGFASSRMPTTTAAVTRAVDIAKVDGADFTSFFNASAGTYFLEFNLPTANDTSVRIGVSADDGTFTERFHLSVDNTALKPSFLVQDGGVTQTNLSTTTTPSVHTFYKMAGAYALNDFSFVFHNDTLLTDNLGTLPTPTILNAGSRLGTGADSINGHIAEVAYWPERKSNQFQEDLVRT